jgi:uncharacterized protein YceH (UPF0502 family)
MPTSKAWRNSLKREIPTPLRERCVSIESEASSLLRALVTPPAPGESVKALIRRAGRRAGLTFSRAKKLWYSEARAIRAEEMDAIRAAAARKQGEAESDLRNEIEHLRARLAGIEARLDLGGEDSAGAAADLVRQAPR